MDKLKVLGICGSLRKESYNRKLLQIAKRYVIEQGIDVIEFDLKENPLPLYDQDIEDQGFPENVIKLNNAVKEADILLIASPEYNHSVTGVLKNAIDWLSRGESPIEGKIAAVFGVSDGRFGTVRGQIILREILRALNIYLLPQPEVLVRFGEKAFDETGNLTDKKTDDKLKDLIIKTIEYYKKIKL